MGDSEADELLRLACLTYGGDDLARAARARELLAAKPELAGRSIHTAAAVGDVDAARRFLDADPALANRLGGPHAWEPLLYLTYSRLGSTRPGDSPLAVARLLVDHGADPNAGFLWEGLSPPFTALTGVFGGGEGGTNQPPHPQARELARLLLEAGADPNDEQTLYNRHFDSSNDHLELLFAHGLGSGDGGPWHRRLAPHHASPAEMLEDQLVMAAARDLPDRVELLLRHGVDPDGRGTSHPIHEGRRATEIAHANGSTRIVELLLDAGATPPAPDRVEELLAAFMRADPDRVGELVAADPALLDASIARDPGRIVHAAELGRTDAVRLMAERGFDVNTRRGRTALHEAAWAGDRALVDLLLSLGADPTIRDAEHDATPAGWAHHNQRDELAEYLSALERADGAARG